jgi:hypothetical protein
MNMHGNSTNSPNMHGTSPRMVTFEPHGIQQSQGPQGPQGTRKPGTMIDNDEGSRPRRRTPPTTSSLPGSRDGRSGDSSKDRDSREIQSRDSGRESGRESRDRDSSRGDSSHSHKDSHQSHSQVNPVPNTVFLYYSSTVWLSFYQYI